MICCSDAKTWAGANPMHIATIGSGISGIAAARTLQRLDIEAKWVLNRLVHVANRRGLHGQRLSACRGRIPASATIAFGAVSPDSGRYLKKLSLRASAGIAGRFFLGRWFGGTLFPQRTLFPRRRHIGGSTLFHRCAADACDSDFLPA